jgi:hypothetical protein
VRDSESPELARAIDALVALLDALEGRVGTDELLPAAVVDETRAAYDALAAADRLALGAVLRASGEPSEN